MRRKFQFSISHHCHILRFLAITIERECCPNSLNSNLTDEKKVPRKILTFPQISKEYFPYFTEFDFILNPRQMIRHFPKNLFSREKKFRILFSFWSEYILVVMLLPKFILALILFTMKKREFLLIFLFIFFIL